MKSYLLLIGWIICSISYGQSTTKPAMNTTEKKLQHVLDQVIDGKKVFGCCFAIKKDSFTWVGASGEFKTSQPYFIASTTKLFTTALIFHLQQDGKLKLHDKISNYLEPEIMHHLHVLNGKDYSDQLTIEHLLAHTSGLPDYFQDKTSEGRNLEEEILQDGDRAWTFTQAIERSKKMKPLFTPGSQGKAHYSDTNFQLLGKIIEHLTAKSYARNCEEYILKPLGLSHTYLYLQPTDTIPQKLYYQSKSLNIPLAMSSFGPDGGMVSTSEDMLVFIEAFFSGKLFPADNISQMQTWNKLFFPMESGIGIHRFKLPWIFNPSGTIPYFIGHSGLSGALAFYSPEQNLFVTGTVNQVAHPDISFKTMIKLAQVLKHK